MAKNSSETLEQGLNRSANKRGYSGKERHRYVGGAIRNMEKRGEIKVKKRGPARPKTTAAPKKAAYAKPALSKREKLELVVKKNAAESKNRPYDVYSIYRKNGTLYSSATYRKRSIAVSEAKIEMDAYNDIRGPHTRGRLA